MHSPLSGRQVLVVEDEMLVALLLQEMLDDLGCVVIGPAASVEEALSLIETQLLDIAVLDVNLSGQMSYPVADALLAHHVPFVFSTGYSANRLQEGYRTHRAVQKPYHMTELRDALADVLAQAKSSANNAPGTGPAHSGAPNIGNHASDAGGGERRDRNGAEHGVPPEVSRTVYFGRCEEARRPTSSTSRSLAREDAEQRIDGLRTSLRTRGDLQQASVKSLAATARWHRH
jgi:CheY-like chemotaxis protein